MLLDRLFGRLSFAAHTHAEHHLKRNREQQQAAGDAEGGQRNAERAKQDALGGVLVAGGYNKATGFLGDPPANRYLIIRYPSKEAAEKHWNDSVSKWWNSEGHKYATFRAVGAEGVMPK